MPLAAAARGWARSEVPPLGGSEAAADRLQPRLGKEPLPRCGREGLRLLCSPYHGNCSGLGLCQQVRELSERGCPGLLFTAFRTRGHSFLPVGPRGPKEPRRSPHARGGKVRKWAASIPGTGPPALSQLGL